MQELEANKSMGGEVAEILDRLLGKEFRCLGVCRRMVVIDKLTCYEHDGGVEAGDGKRYWVYYHCPRCRYDTAWWKIERRLQ